jgi:hypothetical protein
VRHSHSKGKGLGSNAQSRQTSVVPQSHSHMQALAQQSKSTKRINGGSSTITNSLGAPPHAGNIVGSGLFGSASANKKSNRVSGVGGGISYDYRSSDRRCDTVQ